MQGHWDDQLSRTVLARSVNYYETYLRSPEVGCCMAFGTITTDTFNEIKDLLTKTPVLTFYDIKKPIVVSTDASS